MYHVGTSMYLQRVLQLISISTTLQTSLASKLCTPIHDIAIEMQVITDPYGASDDILWSRMGTTRNWLKLNFILFIPCIFIQSHTSQTNRMHTSYLLYNTIFYSNISLTCFGSLFWDHHPGPICNIICWFVILCDSRYGSLMVVQN